MIGLRTDMFTAAGLSGLEERSGIKPSHWDRVRYQVIGRSSIQQTQSPGGLDDNCAVTDVLIERVL